MLTISYKALLNLKELALNKLYFIIIIIIIKKIIHYIQLKAGILHFENYFFLHWWNETEDLGKCWTRIRLKY
jgi:hypothetical protein